jgi:hypothetical protein
LEDEFKQRLEALRFIIEMEFGDAKFGIGVNDREIELFFPGIEVNE